MIQTAGDLGGLASCEEEIEELERELARLPAQIERARGLAHEARETIARMREELAALERERRQREAEIQDAETRRQKFHGQTALVKTNEEYSALLREIEGVSERISQLEDEVLGLFEAADERARGFALAEKELEEQAARFDGEVRAIEERQAALEREYAERRVRREGLVDALGPEARALYARAVQSRGSGVVAVRGGSCAGCHRAIPPQIVNQVLSGELRICENCRRILIIPRA